MTEKTQNRDHKTPLHFSVFQFQNVDDKNVMLSFSSLTVSADFTAATVLQCECQ